MPKCPKCGKKISRLEYIVKTKGTGTLDRDTKKQTVVWNDDPSEGESFTFSCPKCGEVVIEDDGIFTSPSAQEEAVLFLEEGLEVED